MSALPSPDPSADLDGDPGAVGRPALGGAGAPEADATGPGWPMQFADAPPMGWGVEDVVEPRAPSRRARRPRISRALPVGVVIGLLGTGVLTWGCYDLLASVDVFDVALDGAPLINRVDAVMIVLGPLLLLIAFITAIVALVRSAVRWPAALLVIALLLAPLPLAGAGLVQGTRTFKEETMASANAYAGRVDPQTVDAAFDRLRDRGVSVPGRDKIMEILRSGE